MSKEELISYEKHLYEELDKVALEKNQVFIGRSFKSTVSDNLLYHIIGVSENYNPLSIVVNYDKDCPAIAYNEELLDFVPSDDLEVTNDSFIKVMNQILAIISKKIYDTLKK